MSPTDLMSLGYLERTCRSLVWLVEDLARGAIDGEQAVADAHRQLQDARQYLAAGGRNVLEEVDQ